ncbi:APC family permease [Pseudomonas sp. s4]|uniref:APC family permease n=1 Tax=Pseudomonas sp. s4 TaxID=353218 RepID=UPI00398D0880
MPNHDYGRKADASNPALRRVLGLPALVFFGLVYMVPLTIFTTYGIVTQITGGRAAAAYLVTLGAMSFTAASYSFMVKRYPIAGSAYSYTNSAFGPNIGFLTGWSLLLDYLFIPMINYLLIGIFVNLAFPQIPIWLIIVLAIGVVTVLNVVGITTVAKASNVIVAAQLAFIVLFVSMSYKTMAGGEPVNLLLPFLGDGGEHSAGITPLMAGAAILCLSFLGFDAVSTLAEETRDPQRTLPRAIMLTTIGAGILFAVLAYLSQLAHSETTFDNVDTAANEVMLKVGGQWFANLFTAAFVAGSLGSAIASQAAVSRIIYTMARDNYLPRRWLGGLSPRFGTPVAATLLVTSLSFLTLLIDLTTMASLISFGALVAFSSVNLAVIRDFLINDSSNRDLGGLVRYGIIPGVGLCLTMWLWTSLSGLTLSIGVTWFTIGVIYLAVLTSGFKSNVKAISIH